jgi:hypothetical protein
VKISFKGQPKFYASTFVNMVKKMPVQVFQSLSMISKEKTTLAQLKKKNLVFFLQKHQSSCMKQPNNWYYVGIQKG